MVRPNSISKRDENDVPIALGVNSSDSVTPLMMTVDPVTGYLLVSVAPDSLVATSATKNKRDQNDVPTRYGVSRADGVTVIPIRTDSSGRLLVSFS